LSPDEQHHDLHYRSTRTGRCRPDRGLRSRRFPSDLERRTGRLLPRQSRLSRSENSSRRQARHFLFLLAPPFHPVISDGCDWIIDSDRLADSELSPGAVAAGVPTRRSQDQIAAETAAPTSARPPDVGLTLPGAPALSVVP